MILPNLSELISSLRQLLGNDVRWLWTDIHSDVPENIKKMTSESIILILVTSNPKKKE